MTEIETTMVQCLMCRQTVPLTRAVRVVKDGEEAGAGYHLCDGCRLDDLGSSRCRRA